MTSRVLVPAWFIAEGLRMKRPQDRPANDHPKSLKLKKGMGGLDWFSVKFFYRAQEEKGKPL